MRNRLQWVEHLQSLARKEQRVPISLVRAAMANDSKKAGQDRKRVSLKEPHELRSWTESLGVTEQQLKEAVAAVGHSAEKVREYLRKR
jgi:hypothetical protein